MSNLFNFIYEEKDGCNLLCGGKYADHIVVECSYKRLYKYIYYDNNNINYVVYNFTDDDFTDDVGDVAVCNIKYNGISYHFNKYDDFNDIYVLYEKMWDGKKYSFIIYPLCPSPTLMDEYKWDVYMHYTVKGNLVKIWLNLCDNMSRVTVHKIYE